MESVSISIASQVKERVCNIKPKEIFSVETFSDMGKDDVVSKALYRMEKNGEIIRVAHGLYMKPIQTNFGVLKPSLNEIAHAIAEKNHEKLIPTGSTALNMLGFSTQVPMNAVYITNGSKRVLKVGNRKLVFKEGGHKNFLYKTKLIPLLVLAYKELGKDNISEEIKNRTSDLIMKSEEATVLLINDVYLAPVWIKKILLPILNSKNDLD
jgi:hypothetical protein